MNPPFSEREAGEVIARLASISEQVVDLRRDLVQLEGRFELSNTSDRQERSHELDKLRGEIGRRLDAIADDVRDLSADRYRRAGFQAAIAIAWTVLTTVLALYVASK